MTRPVSDILTGLEDFEPSDGNWLALDGLLEELFSSGAASEGVDAMLAVFEKYPTEDGAGVFWAIVHGLESLPGYEPKLVESLRRVSSDFALVMVNRLLNAGCVEVGGIALLSVLDQVAQDQRTTPEIRRAAQEIRDDHTA